MEIINRVIVDEELMKGYSISINLKRYYSIGYHLRLHNQVPCFDFVFSINFIFRLDSNVSD